MSNYRGLLEEIEVASSEAKVEESKFPALIEVDSTLKILDHHELPIAKNFRILETAPLSSEKILAACLLWTSVQVRVAVDQVLSD